MFAPWKKSCDKPRQDIKKQRHYFHDKGPSSQSYDFSSGHVWIWELDYKESWAPKNLSLQTMMLEKTLESPLNCKEIQPVHSKGDQSWIFIARTDAEAETPILCPPDVKKWLIEKHSDSGKDWRQKKETIEDEMVGWHHQLDGHEFEQGPGVGDGQGSLACCSPWGGKEWDMTEWLNWTELHNIIVFNLHSSSIKKLILFLFYRWRKWTVEVGLPVLSVYATSEHSLNFRFFSYCRMIPSACRQLKLTLATHSAGPCIP